MKTLTKINIGLAITLGLLIGISCGESTVANHDCEKAFSPESDLSSRMKCLDHCNERKSQKQKLCILCTRMNKVVHADYNDWVPRWLVGAKVDHADNGD